MNKGILSHNNLLSYILDLIYQDHREKIQNGEGKESKQETKLNKY